MNEVEKIYLASSFDLKDRVGCIAHKLKDEGYEITREWWHKDYKKIDKPDKEWYEDERVKKVCQDNFNAIDEADILVLVGGLDRAIKFKGGDVEVGYAIGKGKPVFSIGQLLRSGMYQPIIHCDSIVGLLRKLEE